jgi:uncharacterized protein YjbJ (UPF0337 family)
MAQEPDRLRQDIESTRASLTHDVDLLTEKTSPAKVAQRRWTAMKEKVMGTSEHARHTAAGAASSAVDTVQDKAARVGDAAREAPRAVAGQARGNPIAAGVIAFGVGLLAATLIPVTDAERRVGQQVKEHGDELTDRAKDLASDVKEDLSGTVQRAAGELKDTARDAAEATKESARSGTEQVRSQARNAVS